MKRILVLVFVLISSGCSSIDLISTEITGFKVSPENTKVLHSPVIITGLDDLAFRKKLESLFVQEFASYGVDLASSVHLLPDIRELTEESDETQSKLQNRIRSSFTGSPRDSMILIALQKQWEDGSTKWFIKVLNEKGDFWSGEAKVFPSALASSVSTNQTLQELAASVVAELMLQGIFHAGA